MGIYLDDPELDRVAREVARLEGVSLAEAVGGALLEKRARLLAAKEEKLRKVRARLQKLHAMPILDPRSPDEILYDEDGLPK